MSKGIASQRCGAGALSSMSEDRQVDLTRWRSCWGVVAQDTRGVV